MGRVEITTELYQRLLGVFRELGADNYTAAARTLGCGIKLAKRAYESGFPENASRGRPALRPIRLVLEEEPKPEPPPPPPPPPLPEHARGVPPIPDYFEDDDSGDDSETSEVSAPEGEPRTAPAATAEIVPCGPVSMLEQPDGLRRHVVGAVDEELKTIAAARNAALGIISMATQVLAGMQPVIIRVRDSLRQQAESDEPANAEIAIKQLARIEEVVSSASETVKNLVQAERLALGSPTEILKYNVTMLRACARAAHEANRIYNLAIKWPTADDDSAMPTWDNFPADRQDVVVRGVQRVLEGHTAAELHESWLADHKAQGWVYGPNLDDVAKIHPCMRPYENLPAEQRMKDTIFQNVVRTMAVALGLEVKVRGAATVEAAPAPTPTDGPRDHIMQFFGYAHLPPHLQEVSKQFAILAERIEATVPRNPERTVAIRKLLEGKDAAVRAVVAK